MTTIQDTTAKNRERIKRKIKALLAKTTENGASEQEALAAMQKAQALMMENFISEREITNPYLTEKCVFKKVKRIHSTYNLTLFLGYLSELFDCEHYYTKYEVVFYGFEEDTELCAYFYEFIIKTCFAERNKYQETDTYRQLKAVHSGRTLVASFVRGFLVGISRKMKDMYEARKKNVSHEVGLMVIDKINKVKVQYDLENIKTRTVKNKGGFYEALAYSHGKEKGNEVSILQGINNSNSERTLKLNQ